MVFIDKTTEHSKASKARLEQWKTAFDEANQAKTLEIHYQVANQTGEGLWKLCDQDVKDQLRKDLEQEQNAICCYCCQSLYQKNTKIEHFLAKSAPDCEGEDKIKAFAHRVFNYENLLLSCDGGEKSQKPTQVKRKLNGQLENIKDLAERLHVSENLLKMLNPTTHWRLGDEIKYTKGTHCDTYKGNKIEPILNPTEVRDCWQHFNLKKDGELMPKIENQNHAVVKTTIETVLNLNEARLKDYRATAWNQFEEALIESEGFQLAFPNADELSAYLEFYLELQLEKQVEPFCFVNYLVVQHLMG